MSTKTTPPLPQVDPLDFMTWIGKNKFQFQGWKPDLQWWFRTESNRIVTYRASKVIEMYLAEKNKQKAVELGSATHASLWSLFKDRVLR